MINPFTVESTALAAYSTLSVDLPQKKDSSSETAYPKPTLRKPKQIASKNFLRDLLTSFATQEKVESERFDLTETAYGIDADKFRRKQKERTEELIKAAHELKDTQSWSLLATSASFVIASASVVCGWLAMQAGLGPMLFLSGCVDIANETMKHTGLWDKIGSLFSSNDSTANTVSTVGYSTGKIFALFLGLYGMQAGLKMAKEGEFLAQMIPTVGTLTTGACDYFGDRQKAKAQKHRAKELKCTQETKEIARHMEQTTEILQKATEKQSSRGETTATLLSGYIRLNEEILQNQAV